LDNPSCPGRIRSRSHDPLRSARDPRDSHEPPAAGIFPDLVTPRHDGLLSRDAAELGTIQRPRYGRSFLPENGWLGGGDRHEGETPAERRKPDAPQNNITRHVSPQIDFANFA
jgi:hypothetical protein